LRCYCDSFNTVRKLRSVSKSIRGRLLRRADTAHGMTRNRKYLNPSLCGSCVNLVGSRNGITAMTNITKSRSIPCMRRSATRSSLLANEPLHESIRVVVPRRNSSRVRREIPNVANVRSTVSRSRNIDCHTFALVNVPLPFAFFEAQSR
jgi:hypothetical protein